MKVLVCGGAGYIGSHMVRALLASGREVVVFDNLSTGHRGALPDVELVVGDLRDGDALASTFATHQIDAVLHFAARSLVGESVARPLDYYAQNVGGTLNLLQAMLHAEVERIVFSSTAAVYGVPEAELIDESSVTRPINPYGASKLMVERVLADAATAHGLRSVVFRYFNAAGADPSGEIGESHEPETHLIPNVLRSVLGTGPALQVFGDDYPTLDGTCVRDYVHVSDLAAAHLRALGYLQDNDGASIFNLGSNDGFSVRQVIEAAERVTGREIPYVVQPRRAGDPPRLVASSALARQKLGWEPQYGELDTILGTAWQWHSAQRY
jgi:UDP-glucose 4-epimerase